MKRVLLILLVGTGMHLSVARGAAPPRSGNPYWLQFAVVHTMGGDFKVAGSEKDQYISELEIQSGWQNYKSLPILERLEKLVVPRGLHRNSDIDYVATLKYLRILDLRDNIGLTDGICRKLAILPRLEVLDLTGSSIGDEGIAQLGKLPYLRRLKCEFLGDKGLIALSKCRKLESLEFVSGKFTVKGTQAFRWMGQLKNLSMGRTLMTSDAQPHLRYLIGLNSLDVSSTYLTNTGFENVTGLPELEHFAFTCNVKTGPSKMAMANLTRMKKLKGVSGGGDDYFLKIVSRCPAIEDVYAAFSQEITDTGVGYLVRCASLRELNLWGSNVSDACIPHLIKMKKLKYVNLFETDVTKEGVNRLRKARPDLKVGTTLDEVPLTGP